MLREHPIFRAPNAVHERPLESVATPKAFEKHLSTPTIDVLPLVEGRRAAGRPGWCSYVNRFGDSPDVEVMCGGVNSKTPEAAAIWRQGNLLHFGFEPGPHEVGQNGRDLLENAIVYISRFTEDRPIAATPSVFVTRRSIPRRDALLASVLAPEPDLAALRNYLGAGETKRLEEVTTAEFVAHFRDMHPFMGLDAEDKLELDPNLVALGRGNADPEMIPSAIAALEAPAMREMGLAALERYVPCGPVDSADAEAWKAWHAENAPYLFFLETGRYRWYVDPLAKARCVPSKELRGPARATALAATD